MLRDVGENLGYGMAIEVGVKSRRCFFLLAWISWVFLPNMGCRIFAVVKRNMRPEQTILDGPGV